MNNSKRQTEALLREYIKRVLNEDLGGDYAGLGIDPMGGMPYGMHYATGNQLYDIFIKPFVDVVDVAAGKTKEVSQHAQSMLKVAFEAIVTTLIPILKDDYAKIFKKEEEAIKKIRSEYSDVYNATWEAFNEPDILFAAFLYRPDLFVTAKLAKKAPEAVARLLNILSGGVLDKTIKNIFPADMRPKKKSPEGPGMPFESVIREDTENNDSVEKLMKLVSNKKVRSILASSPKVAKMSEVGSSLVQNTLKNVYDNASAALTSKSIQELQQKLGKKIPGTEKLAQLPDNERQAAEQMILKGVRDGIKEFYVKQLEGQVKAATDAGLPSEHPYVKDYVSVISKIKNL